MRPKGPPRPRSGPMQQTAPFMTDRSAHSLQPGTAAVCGYTVMPRRLQMPKTSSKIDIGTLNGSVADTSVR